MSEPIDVETSQALVVASPHREVATSNLFGATDAVAVVKKAAEVASALRDVIDQQGLISTISGKKYPKCEAWTLLGTMLGIFPVLQWSRPVQGGWEARVEARTRDGCIVGAAEAQCLKAEKNWSNRDDFAIRSMAQTRATAKALRMPLGFVMTLGGYEATPAEEMVSDHPKHPEPQHVPASSPKPTPQPAPKPEVKADKFPTEATREWMLKGLNALPGMPMRDFVNEFFIKAGKLLPDENPEAISLLWVANSKEQLAMLSSALRDFEAGGEAVWPYSAHVEQGAAKTLQLPSKPTTAAAPANPNDLWWKEIIVPVPRKGQKRADYLTNPDTIGSLYDARHGDDEESQAKRQRLWGFLHHYTASGWVGKDGKAHPPSKDDIEFRKALDACLAYHAANHPGEKL